MTGTPQLLRRAADRGVLIEPGDERSLARVRDSLHSSPPPGVADWIVGATTILLVLDRDIDLTALEQDIERRMVGASERIDPIALASLDIPVRYDGADLHAVAELLALSPAAVVALHTSTEWECQFVGFAPGFGYLRPVGEVPFRLPRRAQARTSVPAGAVALADSYSAVYPRSSPGGWQLIGTTELAMWDVTRQPPNLVSAGQRVRFVAVD